MKMELSWRRYSQKNEAGITQVFELLVSINTIMLLVVIFQQGLKLFYQRKGFREMSANIIRLQAAVAEVQKDADSIGLAIDDLKAMIATLKKQLEQGAIDAAAIDAASEVLEQTDRRLDDMVSPPPAPEPEPEPTEDPVLDPDL